MGIQLSVGSGSGWPLNFEVAVEVGFKKTRFLGFKKTKNLKSPNFIFFL